jgi:hypothetical protein
LIQIQPRPPVQLNTNSYHIPGSESRSLIYVKLAFIAARCLSPADFLTRLPVSLGSGIFRQNSEFGRSPFLPLLSRPLLIFSMQRVPSRSDRQFQPDE